VAELDGEAAVGALGGEIGPQVVQALQGGGGPREGLAELEEDAAEVWAELCGCQGELGFGG
jgi:hypothetical protein